MPNKHYFRDLFFAAVAGGFGGVCCGELGFARGLLLSCGIVLILGGIIRIMKRQYDEKE